MAEKLLQPPRTINIQTSVLLNEPRISESKQSVRAFARASVKADARGLASEVWLLVICFLRKPLKEPLDRTGGGGNGSYQTSSLQFHRTTLPNFPCDHRGELTGTQHQVLAFRLWLRPAACGERKPIGRLLAPRRIVIVSCLRKCSADHLFQEFPYVGQKCWVQTVIGYPLPAGLEDRDPVTVIEVSKQRVVVRNRDRQEFDLPRISLDSGYALILDGERIGEHHPKFAAYFRHALQELEAKPERFTGCESDRLAQISKWRWLLVRNGFDPDAPVPPFPRPQLGSPPTAPSLGSRSDGPRRMNS
jgi:hypothetical protein